MPAIDPVSEVFVIAAAVMVLLLALVCAGMAFTDWLTRRRHYRDVERCIIAARKEAGQIGRHECLY